MKPYLIVRRFIDDGVTHEPGTIAEFDDLRATQLKSFGLVSDVSDSEFNITPDGTAQNEAQPKRKGSK